MNVTVEGESEVPDVVRLVHRLRHGAQQDFVDEPLFLASLDLLEEPLQFLRPHIRTGAEPIAERLYELGEVTERFRIGSIVHAVERRDARGLQIPGHRAIGQEHELFHETVRGETDQFVDVQHRTVVRQFDLGLRQVEIEAARGEPPLVELA